MRINPVVYGVIILVIFMGTILAFQSAGVWSISGKVTASGEKVLPSSDDVETIKGWMEIGDIATAYGVSLDEIIAQFSLPADLDPATPVKDLESETFEVSGLRDWLAARQSGAAVPPPAPVETAPVEPAAPTTAETTAPAAEATEHVAPEKVVNSKVTFQQLLDWGVPAESIEKILGQPLPAGNVVVKDFVSGQGLEFSSIKSALQVEVDKTK